MAKAVEQLEQVTIRFAGDSGDGMQLTGSQFTSETAALGNDLSTLPDFPAEIRAPAGSLPGVSGFQIHFADHDILTPGDQPDVLVAMNPAALKTNLGDLRERGTLVVNRDAFTERNLQKAGYAANPLEDGSLDELQRARESPSRTMTVEALKEVEGITPREAERSKNFFALGLMSWLYGRPIEITLDFDRDEVRRLARELVDANTRAFKAGYHYGETSEDFVVPTRCMPAQDRAGRLSRTSPATRRSRSASWQPRVRSGLGLFLGAYPITPASGILEELARYKHFGVRTFQAEDEIAAAGAALGASFGGALGVTTSAGPGIVLKSETVGLAVALELPLVIVDVQRAGPSTGMPTKPEQADLLMVMFGRNSESPVPVLAASRPGDCFDVALEACRIALTYRTPVYLLSDAYLANGAEPWLIPEVDSLPDLAVEFATKPNSEGRFLPYVRDPETLARQWALPGNARPRAPDRRTGEGGRDGQHLVRPGQPRRHDPPARAEGGGHRRRHPRARGGRSRRRLVARVRAGAGRTARSRPACGASAGTVVTSPTRTCATSTRCLATRVRCSGATTAS